MKFESLPKAVFSLLYFHIHSSHSQFCHETASPLLCDSTDASISTQRASSQRKGERVDECEVGGGEKTKVSEFDSIGANATTKEETDTSRKPSSYTLSLSLEPTGVSDHHHCQESHPVPPPTTDLCFPHLLHLTAEDIDAVSLIEAETCPESYLTESTSDSHSLKSSPRSERTEPPAAPPSDRLELGELRVPTRPSARRSRPSSHGATSLPQSPHQEAQIHRAKSDPARSADSR